MQHLHHSHDSYLHMTLGLLAYPSNQSVLPAYPISLRIKNVTPLSQPVQSICYHISIGSQHRFVPKDANRHLSTYDSLILSSAYGESDAPYFQKFMTSSSCSWIYRHLLYTVMHALRPLMQRNRPND